MKLIVIGGGASGMMAAIAAAGNGKAQVTLLEKKSRPGKKLLATGNGHCNLTNTAWRVENYHGHNPEFINCAMDKFGPSAVMRFFEEIGLLCKETYGGRVFPYCGQASAVLDVLRAEMEKRGVVLESDSRVCKISTVNEGANKFALEICNEAGERRTEYCERVIVAAGGNAAPSTGSNGDGFKILADLGHKIYAPYPALTQLKTDTALAAGMQGVRLEGRARVRTGAKIMRESEGEIQFAAYGLTGPAIMDISADALCAERAVVELDMMPEYMQNELTDMLIARRARLGHLTAESFLVGFLNKKVGQMLLKHAGVAKLSIPSCEMSDRQIIRLAALIKGLEFSVQGHTGWENAQTTAGGADTREFFEESMESKKVKGLFAVGEALDIYGDCGGYNLQWAWASGYLAGVSSVC